MIKRSDEKYEILSTISGTSAYMSGGQGSNYLAANSLMDPDRNPFTKMNIAYIIQQGNLGRPMGGNNQGWHGEIKVILIIIAKVLGLIKEILIIKEDLEVIEEDIK